MKRLIPITEMLPLVELALLNIKKEREKDWEKAIQHTIDRKNNSKIRNFFVRLGWLKHFNRETAIEYLGTEREMFAGSARWQIFNQYSYAEDDFERIVALCNVTANHKDVEIDGKTARMLINWTKTA